MGLFPSGQTDRQGEVQYAANQVTAPLDPIVHGPLKELIKVICLCEGLGYLPPALGQSVSGVPPSHLRLMLCMFGPPGFSSLLVQTYAKCIV